MAHRIVSSEFAFYKKDKEGKEVKLDLIVMYNYSKYQLSVEGQEQVLFEGEVGDIERDLILSDLCKEAMLFVKKEFGK